MTGKSSKPKRPGATPPGTHVVADQSEVIEFLSRPGTYGISSAPVRIDTHAAVIFLAGDHAYKMKRAVRFPFLDFSTLERRRLTCEAELALNRKAAPEIYLDTLPVVRRDGALRLGGDGEAVEWLLRMRRFDPENTLDHVADRGALTDMMLAEIVAAIAAWHARAPVGDGDAATARLASWMRGNCDELGEAPQAIPGEEVEELRLRSEAAFARMEPLLLARGRNGHVRRCHGDLHLRNIVLIDGRPHIFDALEFDEDFATHDLFYDLAFLLMDLWQRGLRYEANRVLNRYLWRRDDPADIEGCALLPLLMSIRAAIRAKVAMATAAVEESDKARQDIADARRYFAFAEAFLVPAAPVLVAVGGLSGTGKSSLAAALASEIGGPPGAVHIRSDIERKRLFGAADTERLPQSTYTREAGETVYARLSDKAGRCLAAGLGAVVDAVHAAPAERAAIAAVAREHGVPFVGIWLDAPEGVLLDRVTARRGDASDADTVVVRRQLDYDLGQIDWHRLDASQDPDTVRQRALAILQDELAGLDPQSSS